MALASTHLDLQTNFRQWTDAKLITSVLYIKYKGVSAHYNSMTPLILFLISKAS